MRLSDLISDLQAQADRLGPDATVELYSRSDDRTLVSDPDTEQWDWEVLVGDDRVVIEFD